MNDFDKLQKAVFQLYYAACWRSDRLSKDVENQMWKEVRDAAGFMEGFSPKGVYLIKLNGGTDANTN